MSKTRRTKIEKTIQIKRDGEKKRERERERKERYTKEGKKEREKTGFSLSLSLSPISLVSFVSRSKRRETKI